MIKRRERTAIIRSLQAGVVPSIGLRHIQVGRQREVEAVVGDLDLISHGGAAVRFVAGRYGSGKSFFLNLMRLIALEKGFVVLQADITPDRRLHASAGQARSLYSELVRNAAVRSKPDGGALPGIVERWVSELEHRVRQSGGGSDAVAQAIQDELRQLKGLVGGYDFATVVRRYYEGFQAHNDELCDAALRWLRAEYSTKTDARNALGVRAIIDDHGFYDYLKLFAGFVRLAGYCGLLVNLDEMGVLSHRLNSSQARNSNYEVILRILNDCLQGNVEGLGVIFAGTTEFVEDRRRGLASYEALATRLASNTFAVEGVTDTSGPVLSLQNLTPEDLFVLLKNIRHVFAGGEPAEYLVPDEALVAFLNDCARTLGAEFYLTPRDAVKSFVGFLQVMEQNPRLDWRDVLQRSGPTTDDGGLGGSSSPKGSDVDAHQEEDGSPEGDLKAFRL